MLQAPKLGPLGLPTADYLRAEAGKAIVLQLAGLVRLRGVGPDAAKVLDNVAQQTA